MDGPYFRFHTTIDRVSPVTTFSHRTRLCYLYDGFAGALTIHFIHAPPFYPVGFREAAFPWTSLHRLICNAPPPIPLLRTPPTPPLHYVAFASYCLCIASARLVLHPQPPLYFSLCPLHLCSSVGSMPIFSSLAARDGWWDTAQWVCSSGSSSSMTV